MKGADRLNHFEEYYFSNKLREIRELEKKGRSIINLGIGSPDVVKLILRSLILRSVFGLLLYDIYTYSFMFCFVK